MQKFLIKAGKLGGFLFFFILLIALSFPTPAAAQEPEIFLTTLETQSTYDFRAAQNQLGTERVQPVKLQSSVLSQIKTNLLYEPQTLKLQIFSDLELSVIVKEQKRTSPETSILSGVIRGDPEGSFLLAETNGIVSANIVYHHTQYQLRQTENNYFFIKIDQSQFPQEAEPINPEILTNAKDTLSFDSVYDSGAIIDIMVVYTPSARLLEGGTTATQNLINLAVEETNTGYANSAVNHRMRLVHTEEVNYPETDFDWSSALNRLQGSSDGYIDNVHTLRDQHGADLVVMIVANQQYCGIGYLLPAANSTYDQAGFSIVSSNCATGYYSFAHETGHNMGAHHDRANASGTGLYPYSYGYQAPDQSFRTIMAYNCPSYCYRTNQWSNPEVLYNGQPTGVYYTDPLSADNRRTLNNSATAVSNFRESVNLSAPTNLTSSSTKSFSVSLLFTDNSMDETGFRIERSLNNSTWSTLVNLPMNTTTYFDTAVSCNSTYYYRVKAYNAVYESEPSNTFMTQTQACSAPDAPLTQPAVPTLTSVIFKWTDTLGETSYKIQQSPNGTTGWFDLLTLPANTTQATVNDLTKDTNYFFRIVVVNPYGTNATPALAVKTHSDVVYLPLTIR